MKVHMYCSNLQTALPVSLITYCYQVLIPYSRLELDSHLDALVHKMIPDNIQGMMWDDRAVSISDITWH